jgi:hypothetical protein
MYKLVVVAGKLRGEEYILEEGENVLGRDSGCDIHFPVPGVSKKHMSVTATGDTCYIEDLGSANGTFLNGKAVERTTVKSGDKIALPDTVIQVVYVKEKKILIKRKVSDEEEEEDDLFNPGAPPQTLVGKIPWFFRYKLMPVIHGINEEYEWKHLVGILLAIFCFIAVSLTIFPVLEESKKLLLNETAKRGAHYADEVARINNRALEQKKLDKIDTNFIRNEEGVKAYRLFDLEGRIVRPSEKLNEYVQDPFFVDAHTWSKKTIQIRGKPLGKLLSDGEIGIAKKIWAFNAKIGTEEAVGVIAIKFEPTALKVEAAKSSKAYLEALSVTVMVGIIFYGIVYYLTILPIEEMRIQIEESLRGKRKNLASKYLMIETNGLRNTVNALLQRLRELNNEDEDEFAEVENDSGYVTTLYEFMQGAQGPILILDSQKNVAHLNLEAEDLIGIRENASQGMNLLDVAREQGFAATLIELCDNSGNNNGTHQQGEYELGGVEHSIHTSSLIGKDGFAKAFYISFVKDS